MGMTVYFDNAATTRVCPEAAAAALDAMTERYGNPSSAHGPGRAAAALLEDARESVAAALGAEPGEVRFTSGGTEGDNWAVTSALRLMRGRGNHIVTTAVEHDAVRKTVQKLAESGAEATFVRPGPDGRVSVSDVAAAVREDTALVSVMLVNNETGAVNDIRGISEMLRARGSRAVLHTDAVQGFLKVPFTPRALGADLVTVSSHKIHGPKGAGALWIRSGLRLPPMLTGGGQEGGLRPGTEAMPALAGFGAAAKVGKALFPGSAQTMRLVRARTAELVKDALPQAVIIGAGDAPHILSLSLPGYRSEVLMSFLDAQGVCVSRSSACRKGARSHVLEAMNLPGEVIDGAIRLSFSRYSTAEEAEYFVKALLQAAARLAGK